MHEYQKQVNRLWAEMEQKQWAGLKIDPPKDLFEKKCVEALESDPRIKVIGLSIREMTKHDLDTTGFYNADYGDVLLFRFQCPCGDTITELQALGTLWVPRFPQLLEDLRTGTYQHLRSEGFVV